MYLLLWNWDFYLYDLRLFRYFSLFAAILFMIAYFTAFAIEMDLVLLEGKVWRENNLPEVMIALIIGELILLYAPTALINSYICMKELTLNQFAWRKEDDYKEGEVFNSFSIDALYWLGFD